MVPSGFLLTWELGLLWPSHWPAFSVSGWVISKLQSSSSLTLLPPILELIHCVLNLVIGFYSSNISIWFLIAFIFVLVPSNFLAICFRCVPDRLWKRFYNGCYSLGACLAHMPHSTPPPPAQAVEIKLLVFVSCSPSAPPGICRLLVSPLPSPGSEKQEGNPGSSWLGHPSDAEVCSRFASLHFQRLPSLCFIGCSGLLVENGGNYGYTMFPEEEHPWCVCWYSG